MAAVLSLKARLLLTRCETISPKPSPRFILAFTSSGSGPKTSLALTAADPAWTAWPGIDTRSRPTLATSFTWAMPLIPTSPKAPIPPAKAFPTSPITGTLEIASAIPTPAPTTPWNSPPIPPNTVSTGFDGSRLTLSFSGSGAFCLGRLGGTGMFMPDCRCRC